MYQMTLRKYLYIDEDFVNNAFAMINGFDYDSKDIQHGGDTSLQDKSDPNECREHCEHNSSSINAKVTIAAKLQSIIDYLNNNAGGIFPYYEDISKQQFSFIRREDFFEGRFKLSFTKIETYGNLAESVQKLDELCGTNKTVGIESFEQIKRLAKQEREKGIPCILKFLNSSTIPAFAYLNEQYIKTNYRYQMNEVTILCKVIRILKNGESVCLTDISELMNMRFPDTPQGKKDRVTAIKNGDMTKLKAFEDKIVGPALEVLPIAIYQ